MILFPLLAAAYTFTATATGVEKGTPLEFVFASSSSDRAYESMFLIDGSVDAFCKGLESAGIPRGRPIVRQSCHLWPVGCHLRIEPPIESFVSGKLPNGTPLVPIYTGGTRSTNGTCLASSEMPSSVFSVYSLPQSPIVLNGIFDQGAVYGLFLAAKKLEKGKRFSFTISGDETTVPRSLALTVSRENATNLVKTLMSAAAQGEVEACVSFDARLTVEEATAIANALATIDSVKVKINGRGNVFYRAFLPLVKWRDRKERMQQPFELTISSTEPDKLVYIEEDWTVEGDDPKLTPKEISFEDVAKFPQTDTCFIFASAQDTVSRILQSMSRIKGDQILNWYVFTR